MIKQKNIKTMALIGAVSLFFCLFYFYLLPRYDVSNLNKNLFSLDLLSNYSREDVNQLFNTIGISGMNQYYNFLIVDTFYIFIYTYLSILIIVFLQNNMGRFGTLTSWFRYFPIVVATLDTIENINTFSLLKFYPNITDGWVNFGSIITGLKWYCVSVLAGIIICYIFYAVLRNLFWRLKKTK